MIRILVLALVALSLAAGPAAASSRCVAASKLKAAAPRCIDESASSLHSRAPTSEIFTVSRECLPCAACTDATEEEIAWSASAWWPSRWNAKIALLSSGRMAEEDGEPGEPGIAQLRRRTSNSCT